MRITRSYPMVDTKIKCPQCKLPPDTETHVDVRTFFMSWTHYGLRCPPYALSCDACGALYYVTEVRVEHYYTTSMDSDKK